MTEKFDAIVVGGGVSGLAAAYIMAKKGLKVIIIEKGNKAGSKNVMGGILYRKMMEDIIPEFWKEAPLERPIVEQNIWIMGENSITKIGYKGMEWAEEPHNCYSVFRGKFDNWFAKKCVEAGALLITETVVTSCIIADGTVVGVNTDRPDGDLYADVVVLADGANSLLAKDLGFHKEWKKEEVALAVMEVLKLPKATIEQRFNLDKGMGAAIEIFGDGTLGMVGTAFVYTNKEHISIGCGTLLSQMVEKKVTPYDLLEHLKNHPAIKPLIADATQAEYYAHLIPEGGYHSIPTLVGDGVLVIGDAAQFVNGLHREGSNMATESGKFAAETIIKAKELGKFDKKTLSSYETSVRNSFIVKDLKKYRNASKTLETNPSYFKHYIPQLNKAVGNFLTVDGITKVKKQMIFIKDMLKGKNFFVAAGEVLKLLWAVK